MAVLAGLAVTSFISPAVAPTVGPVGLLVGGFSSGVAFIVGARGMDSRERLSWTLIGVGLLLAATGVVAFGVVSSITQLAAFGPPDILLLLGYGVGIVGFTLLPQVATDWSERLRVLLDGLIGAVSAGVIAWLLVLGDLLGKLQGYTAWDRWAGSAYPILDVVAMVAIILVMLRRSTYRFDIRLVLVALGFVAQSIADVAYLSSGVGQTFEQARPFFAMNITGQIFFFGAAMLVPLKPERREYADRKAPLAALFAPYGLALLMSALLLVRIFERSTNSDFWALLWGTIAVGGMVMVRQMVSIQENRALVERQRTALISSVSHELRTPLTAIVGFLDVLADQDAVAPDEREEMIGVVRQQAHYMARIVSDIVLLARDGLESVELSPTNARLSRLIDSALVGIDRNGYHFTVELESDPVVYVDPQRLQQIVVNLVSNAMRYGGGRVAIRGRSDDGTLVIEVHDDGPGVPTRYEFAIWERFDRGPHRLDATRPGSGIGLAVVRAVARAHGGSASYRRSDLLGGSCFSVQLPQRVVKSISGQRRRRLA